MDCRHASDGHGGERGHPAVFKGEGHPATEWNFPDFPRVVGMLWVIGTAVGLVRLGIAFLQVAVWKKSLIPPDDSEWLALHRLVPEAPARHHFRICQRTVSPCVTGFWRPKIVIPEFLLRLDSTEELRWAVLHEIGHWKANDSRWMLIINLIRCPNWWNPLVHQLIYCWDDAREQLCDLQAVGGSENRAIYGAFLISMARQVTKKPPLAIAMAKSRHARRLKRRIVSLLDSAKTREPLGKGFITLSSGLFAMVATGVSVMKIGAEENKAPEVIAEQKTAAVHPERLETQNWMVFSKTPGHWKNGEVLKDGELLPWVEKAKTLGSVTVDTSGGQPYGTTQTFETRCGLEKGWGHGNYEMFRDVLLPGVSYESSARYEANQTVLNMRAIYRFPPGCGFPLSSIPPPPYSPDKPFHFKEARAEARLSIGEAVCIDLGEVEPGIFAQAFSMAVPQTARGRAIGTYSGNEIEWPSVDVKGKVRISGVRVDVPSVDLRADLKRLRLPDLFIPKTDSLTWVQPRFQEIWESVLGAEIQKLPPVDLPLVEFYQPWPKLPDLQFSAYISEDYKWVNLTMLPGHDVLDQEIQTLPITSQTLPISFKLRNPNPKTESRVFLKIEAVKP
jgi:beta-lactamase regulating signal transducer with metallopeptidase domain